MVYYQTSGANVMNNTFANIVFNPGTGTNNAVIEANYGGPNLIKDNVIHDISCSSTAATIDATAALTGINAPMYGSGITIEHNTIYNLTTANIASTGTITVQGIYLYGNSAVVLRNSIYNLKTSNTGGNANVFGIHMSGSSSITNNLISLGTGISGPANINGIITDGGTSNLCYFNSINIVGTATAGTNSSNAFYRNGTPACTLNNNIFSNSRTGGTGVHSAVRTTSATGTYNSNNNDLFVTGPTLGFWGGVAQADLVAWKATSAKDAASISIDPLFTSATDLTHLNYGLNAGIPISGITTDIIGVTRNITTPTIGAYEIPACTNPTFGGTIDDAQAGCDPFDPVPVNVTLPTGQSGTLEYMWQSSVSPFTSWTDITSNTETYDPGPISVTTWYKRLARVTCKSTWVGAAESGVVIMTVTQLVAAAGAIAGSTVLTPGATAVPYSVGAITNATSYVWAYTGTGVTVNYPVDPLLGYAVTLDFDAGATAGQLSVKGNNACGDGTTATLNISGDKTLNLTSVFLEGLYNGAGTMRQAWNATGPQWPAGIADHITVELHDATTYATIIYSVPDVALSTTGTATLTIPGTYGASYYITIRHRNSLETTTLTSISFAGSTISQSFGAPGNVFGGNLGVSFDSYYLIYTGDANQDGFVDSGDFTPVVNDALNYAAGYLTTDIDGNGSVDSGDYTFLSNNSNNYISTILP